MAINHWHRSGTHAKRIGDLAQERMETYAWGAAARARGPWNCWHAATKWAPDDDWKLAAAAKRAAPICWVSPLPLGYP